GIHSAFYNYIYLLSAFFTWYQEYKEIQAAMADSQNTQNPSGNTNTPESINDSAQNLSSNTNTSGLTSSNTNLVPLLENTLTNPFPTNLNHILPIKLDGNNFLL
ncbi:hypothetical protein PanWU01x14_107350, partial [Parasponia andersonii]